MKCYGAYRPKLYFGRIGIRADHKATQAASAWSPTMSVSNQSDERTLLLPKKRDYLRDNAGAGVAEDETEGIVLCSDR